MCRSTRTIFLGAWLLISVSSTAVFAEPLKPIEEPKTAETDADVEKVNELIKQGVKDKKDTLRRLKKGVRDRQPLAEIAPASIKRVSRMRNYYPTLKRVEKGAIGVFRSPIWYSSSLESFDVLQIIDKENMLIQEDDDIYWLSGFSTDGLADGKRIDGLAAVVEVVGTKSYSTRFGKRTVFWIKPYPYELFPEKKRIKRKPKVKVEVKAKA